MKDGNCYSVLPGYGPTCITRSTVRDHVENSFSNNTLNASHTDAEAKGCAGVERESELGGSKGTVYVKSYVLPSKCEDRGVDRGLDRSVSPPRVLLLLHGGFILGFVLMKCPSNGVLIPYRNVV